MSLAFTVTVFCDSKKHGDRSVIVARLLLHEGIVPKQPAPVYQWAHAVDALGEGAGLTTQLIGDRRVIPTSLASFGEVSSSLRQRHLLRCPDCSDTVPLRNENALRALTRLRDVGVSAVPIRGLRVP